MEADSRLHMFTNYSCNYVYRTEQIEQIHLHNIDTSIFSYLYLILICLGNRRNLSRCLESRGFQAICCKKRTCGQLLYNQQPRRTGKTSSL